MESFTPFDELPTFIKVWAPLEGKIAILLSELMVFFHFKIWNTKIPFFANWVIIKLTINWLDHIYESDDCPVTK